MFPKRAMNVPCMALKRKRLYGEEGRGAFRHYGRQFAQDGGGACQHKQGAARDASRFGQMLALTNGSDYEYKPNH
jgi:hypothetical protein